MSSKQKQTRNNCEFFFFSFWIKATAHVINELNRSQYQLLWLILLMIFTSYTYYKSCISYHCYYYYYSFCVVVSAAIDTSVDFILLVLFFFSFSIYWNFAYIISWMTTTKTEIFPFYCRTELLNIRVWYCHSRVFCGRSTHIYLNLITIYI